MNLGCIDYMIKFLFLPSVGQINKSGGHQVVRTIGSNVVTMGIQGKPGKQIATMGGNQTIINKPGGGQQQIMAQDGQQIIRTAGGQQLIVKSTAAGGMGGMKTVQQMTTSQAGGEFTFISYSIVFFK